jgi:hypothetical protein
MRGNHHGLPPAASVEQAIILAQLIIAKELACRITKEQEIAKQADHRQCLEGNQD